MNALKKYVPITGWIPSYQLGWLRFDLIAGLTLWGILVPEAIAYAGMAGAPVQAGLYAFIFSLPLFAVFGTSRQLAVAATSSTSIMIAAVLAPMVGDNPDQYPALLAALVVSVGVIFLLAGLLRLGFISSFLSEPVMTGFVFGLAIYIAVHQLPKIFGVSSGEGDTVQQLWHIITKLGETNWYAFAIGAGSIALLFLLHRFAPRVPGALVALLLGILAVTIFNLAASPDISTSNMVELHKVAVVGEVDGGLPSVVFPDISWSQFGTMLSGAFGIALVALAEALGAARTFADKYDYKIDVDQEMIAIGAGNTAAGFFGGLVVGGGMSSSTVNDQAGARTQVSSITAAAMGLVTLLVLMPLFKNLPEAVLGAIVIHAVTHLMKVKEMRRLFKLRRLEFVLAMVALVGVVTLEILPGLLLAVALSLLLLVWKASQPVGAVLGRVPGESGAYSSIERHPDNQPVEGLTILRFDVPLFFANASQQHDRMSEMMRADPPPRALLVDLQASPELDVSSLDMLAKTVDEAAARGITVMFCEVIEAVRQSFEKSGLLEKLGDDRVFHTTDEGVQYFLRTLQAQGEPPAEA